MSTAGAAGLEAQGTKRTRTRSGCLNCRRKKRKCDETKPRCLRCSRVNEDCEWGTQPVTFLPANVHGVSPEGGFQEAASPSRKRRRQFEILDVTDAVVRENQEELTSSPQDDEPSRIKTSESPAASHFSRPRTLSGSDIDVLQSAPYASPVKKRALGLPTGPGGLSVQGPGIHPELLGKSSKDFAGFVTPSRPIRHEVEHDAYATFHGSPGQAPSPRTELSPWSRHIPTSQSQAQRAAAAADLLSLRSSASTRTTSDMIPTSKDPLAMTPNFPYLQMLTPHGGDYPVDEEIFRPGSTYSELQITLRNHLIKEGEAGGPSQSVVPKDFYSPIADKAGSVAQSSLGGDTIDSEGEEEAALASRAPVVLSSDDEQLLWQNWVEEVGPWLDKFDQHRHFQFTLPSMAPAHPHLRYSILACSARQIERRNDPNQAAPGSLALYQTAIHLLVPLLATRSTAVIASSVVLCVLEMMSCSPRDWRRHLDGCASLLQAVGINGFSGGVEQALFWCFVRMDVCGGFISWTKTIIPVYKWTPEKDLTAAIELFRKAGNFDAHANQAVFLCANVLDRLTGAESLKLTSTQPRGISLQTPQAFDDIWLQLWNLITEWYTQRPKEMAPIFLRSTPNSSFPRIIFSNAPGISGSQLYHTASLLMLQHKPTQVKLAPKSRSILWHARRIVAISRSNNHHGAWTNCLQPIWFAGRCFSSPAEHQAILELLERIENETGWATRWRALDLKDWWGDLED